MCIVCQFSCYYILLQRKHAHVYVHKLQIARRHTLNAMTTNQAKRMKEKLPLWLNGKIQLLQIILEPFFKLSVIHRQEVTLTLGRQQSNVRL